MCKIATVRLLKVSCWPGFGLGSINTAAVSHESIQLWRRDVNIECIGCIRCLPWNIRHVLSVYIFKYWNFFLNEWLLLDFSNFIGNLTNSQRQRQNQSCALWAWRASHCTTWRATSRFDSFPSTASYGSLAFILLSFLKHYWSCLRWAAGTTLKKTLNLW